MRKCAFETRCDFFTMDQIVRAATSVHLNLVEVMSVEGALCA